jgi:SAM-dependent methyltransferase
MAGGQDRYFAIENGELNTVAQQRHWLAAHRKKIARLLAPQRTDHLVDLGCGEGYLTLPLSRSAGQSLGVDFAKSALQALQEQLVREQQRIHLILATGGHLPLGDVSVDKLLCNHMLEHVIDDDAVLREIHRVVRPGGNVLIGVPLAFTLQVRLLIRLRRLLRPRSHHLRLERVQPGHLVPELIGMQSHVRFYSLRAVLDLLERNGFRVLRAEGIGLGMRGPLAGVFRRNSLLFGLGTIVSRLFPGVGDGVLVLAERISP